MNDFPNCNAPTDPRITELAMEVAQGRDAKLIGDMMRIALQLGRDKTSQADLKLLRRSMCEIREASVVFAKYPHRRKVTVYGSARTLPDSEEFKQASRFGRRMAEEDYMVITGGGDGIMGAAQLGAGAANSFGLNIRLPFEQSPNPTIAGDPKLIDFNYFFTRKLNFMKESHAFALFPGGFGTQDEGFECLTLMQTGKTQIVPVLLIDRQDGYYWETWRRFLINDLRHSGLISESDFHLFKLTHSVEEAVAEILQFYGNFHSYRWVRDRMVIRIQRRLTSSALADLNRKFKDALIAGRITQEKALPEEQDDVAIIGLPRIVLTPNKHDFGRLRLLIDAINDAESEASSVPEPVSKSDMAPMQT